MRELRTAYEFSIRKLKSDRYQPRPFLIGTTGYGEGYLTDFYYNQTTGPELLANWKGFRVHLLEYPESVLDPTFKSYFDGQPTEANAINMLRFRVHLKDYSMYKTVEYYTRYDYLRRNPVDQYNFNSYTSFSVLRSGFRVEGRVASHADDLFYLFPMKVIEPLLFRKAPKVEMKDYWVHFTVDYAIQGRELWSTRRCRRSDMMRGNGEFTDIHRSFSKTANTVRVSTSDKIDLAEVKAHKAVDYLLRSCVKLVPRPSSDQDQDKAADSAGTTLNQPFTNRLLKTQLHGGIGW